MRSNGSRAMNSSGSKSRIFRDKREEMQLLPHPSPSLPNTLQAPGEDPSPLRQSLPPGLSLGQYGEVYSRAHSPLLQHHRPDCRAEGMLCDPKGPSRPLGLDIRIIWWPQLWATQLSTPPSWLLPCQVHLCSWWAPYTTVSAESSALPEGPSGLPQSRATGCIQSPWGHPASPSPAGHSGVGRTHLKVSGQRQPQLAG